MSAQERSCLIVGAGISGLLAATVLRKHDVKVTLLEKSRGVGGRMATRRVHGDPVDHGAQYFTVKDRIFNGWVEAWENEGILKEWFSRLEEESSQLGHTRYCCREGMTQLPKHLARDLDVRLETKVKKIHFKDGHWFVNAENGDQFDAKYLMLTAPGPQSVGLLKESNIVLRRQKLEALEAIRYDPCLTVIGVLDGPSGLPNKGGIKLREEPLSWIGDNKAKGIAQTHTIVTIHSSHAYAREHLESGEEGVKATLVEAAQKHLDSKVVESFYQRWRYALAESPFESPFFFSRRHGLLLAGDSFGGGRVENAALSGIEAAAHLVDFL